MKYNKSEIVKFAQELVRTPSRAGIDDPTDILEKAYSYGKKIDLPVEILKADNNPVALVAKIEGKFPGKTWCLNACIDTASAPTPKSWQKEIFSGDVENDFLYGRGAADSKIAVSNFMHIASDLKDYQEQMHGNLMLIFDADEHTGNFTGIKTAVKQGYKPDGIMVGYPNNKDLKIGARGFSRYEITINGKGAHSGASTPVKNNAIVRMGDLINEFSIRQPRTDKDENFQNKQPKVSVTEAHAGNSFGNIPSQATIKLDIRLTPLFNERIADKYVEKIIDEHNHKFDVAKNNGTRVKKIYAEPAFSLDETSEIRTAMEDSIKDVTATEIPSLICGPSNIGCYLSKLGIDATVGYGVTAHKAHAPNERADLRDLEKVYNVYKSACKKLLKINA